MYKVWMFGVLFSVLLNSSIVNADEVICSVEQETGGEVYAVKGSNINIRKGPSKDSDRVIDPDASEEAGSTQYAMVSKGHIVRVNCQQDGWSQINVLSPDWLRKSHRGWVMSRFLSK